MKIYRTTCYQVMNPDEVAWVRYGTNKIRYAAAVPQSWHGKRRRVTLDMTEIPDDSWQRVADTEEKHMHEQEEEREMRAQAPLP